MTGAELKQMREDLGEAIGRLLSLADMARLCGLSEKNGKDQMRKWEDGDGPSGSVAALLSLLGLASEAYKVPEHMFLAGFNTTFTTRPEAVLRAMILEEIRWRLS